MVGAIQICHNSEGSHQITVPAAHSQVQAVKIEISKLQGTSIAVKIFESHSRESSASCIAAAMLKVVLHFCHDVQFTATFCTHNLVTKNLLLLVPSKSGSRVRAQAVTTSVKLQLCKHKRKSMQG